MSIIPQYVFKRIVARGTGSCFLGELAALGASTLEVPMVLVGTREEFQRRDRGKRQPESQTLWSRWSLQGMDGAKQLQTSGACMLGVWKLRPMSAGEATVSWHSP